MSLKLALSALARGEFIIITDDPKRENEGDLVLAAECVTEEKIAFMIHHTGGVVCLALSNAIADQLDLPPMVMKNTSKRGTNFTVSIEAAKGIGTGISARDRMTTIRAVMKKNARPDDLCRPGHVFPLRAAEGGVLWRSGHTEASIDLCTMAGLRPGAAISELMHEDGTLMRSNSIKKFAQKYKIPVVSVAEIIAAKRAEESLVTRVATSELKTAYGTWEIRVYRDVHQREHVALVYGTSIRASDAVLVRMHSECLTGDVFSSLHCDCGSQLHAAMQGIQHEGQGVIVYLRQEGRGIGLGNKIKAYALQRHGMDTVDANRALGLPDDIREYGVGAEILRDLSIRKIRLLTNNPKKVVGLSGYGLQILEEVPLEITPKSPEQRSYLQTKKKRMGHRLRGV